MNIKPLIYCKITLSVLFLISCTNQPGIRPVAGAELLETNILSDVLDRLNNDSLSIQEITDFTKASYNVDFGLEYEKMRSHFIVDQDFETNARGSDIVMSNMPTVLKRHGIVVGTPVYQFLENMSALFDSEASNAQMAVEFKLLKEQAVSDKSLNESDRGKIVSALTLITSNYNGIVAVVSKAFRQASGGRSQGLFSVVWRVVRSVVVTAAVGALMGIPGGYPAIAIGATIAGSAAIADYRVNDYCHFALQCGGGWRQDCMTGECKPYTR